MAVSSVSIDSFLDAARSYPILDVRSPGEYHHAHIPGAQPFPLFTDAERKVIGTAYKQESRETAIKIGLDAFGPKMRQMVEAAETLCRNNKVPNKVLIHCWRGGMRSSAVAWLLDLYGFQVQLLEGGYKAYRHWVLAHWTKPVSFRILAGNTGTGKTDVLHALAKTGAPVLDLEAIARHKGSAFGALPNEPQPTQEMFENQLATRISELLLKHGKQIIWVEDESRRIGNLNLPAGFFKRLETMPKVFLSLPEEQRLERIVLEYGKLPAEGLINNIIRIRKRLGPLETKTAVSLLIEGDIRGCFRILLKYYDKRYYPISQSGAFSVDCTNKSVQEITTTLNQLRPND